MYFKLKSSSKQRLKRRIKLLQKEYKNRLIGYQKIRACMSSINGHLSHGHTYKLREKLYNKTVFTQITQ